MKIIPSDVIPTALAIACYCGSSISMTLVNKYVLSDFKNPPVVFLMLSVQALSCILLVHAFGFFGFLTFRSFNRQDAKKWLPVSVVMSLMLYTGSKSLEHLEVGIFTVFKNLTIILVAYGERAMFDSPVSPLMLVSFILMIISSIIGGSASQVPDQTGIIWMICNCISSASFVLYMRKAIKTVTFKDFDTVYFNNFLTFPIFLTLSFLLEDWSGLKKHYSSPENSDVLGHLFYGLLMGGICAFAISYTSAWCIRVTSSTTYSMVGALNKLPVAVFGMVFFKEAITTSSVSAVLLSFFSGLVYTRAKNIQQNRIKSTVSSASNNYQNLVQEEDSKSTDLPIALNDISKNN
ncbi:GDP-mannose transporter into the lumen of the Golgi [Entomophthora muscae]|uniref:GDP-mannose transporter into the lumen of the Golgi n=2 Tax=Entomophthora muscae TaxID=34485 RepID=A0ACC2UF32_9FUNG|nr:GDP-mannose transporter into the lumen of the Golgi [Entomophthora muscae]